MGRKKIISLAVAALIIAGIIAGVAFEIKSEKYAREITAGEAEQIVNDGFDAMANTNSLKFIAAKNSIAVNDISYGEEKDIILDCTVSTIDAHSALLPYYDSFMSAELKKKNGTMFKSALDFKLEFEEDIISLLASAPEKSENTKIYLYDTKDGLVIYASDEAVNSVFGGIIDIKNDINEKTSYIKTLPDGKTEEASIESANIKKGFISCVEAKRDAKKPDTSGTILKTYNKLKYDFTRNFIDHGRWKTIFKGLWTTIKLTFFALIIGIIIGFLVAFIRCTYIKNTKHGVVLRVLNAISQLYLTVTRGTPVVVQIMIIYFVIFMPIGVDKFIAAVICFGLNSGAYVAEIVRGGIMSIDNGQIEAGRSLGFNYMQTMWYIVFPQAFKAVLPALANEFVVLLKETSIAFYIGLGDLMYAGNAIRAATYSAFMPLVAVALIYLVMVLALSKLVSLLERRLRNSER